MFQTTAPRPASENRRRRVLSSEKDFAGAQQVRSQNEYQATPYHEAQWEIVGEQVERTGFAPMELEIMADELGADPMFMSFDEGVAAAGDRWLTGVGRVAKEIEVEAEPQIDQAMLDEFGNKRHAEGYEEGFAAGKEAAEATIAERYRELNERLSNFIGEIEEAHAKQAEYLAEKAFHFALNVSQKLIATTIEAKPEYILDVLRAGMKSLGAAKPSCIRVSAQDYEFLEIIGLPVDLTPTELGVRYVADESIKSGCIIETDYGEVNLEIDRMWEQVKDSLFSVCS